MRTKTQRKRTATGSATRGAGPLCLPPPTPAERLGALLFRYRTWSLMPVAVAVVAAAWTTGSARVARGVLDLALLAAAAGALVGAAVIRLHVAGRAERGTSSRGVTFEAGALVTSGMYARVRNPLYLANVLIWCGLAMLSGSLAVVCAAIGVTVLQYRFIILAEERFLRGRYGRRYVAYCRRVPRWLPRRGRAGRDAPAPFTWTRALFREADTLLLLVLGAWLVAGLSRGWAPWQSGAEVSGGAYLLPGVAVAVWLAVKWQKKLRWKRREREG